VTLNYLGNSTHKASSGTATVEVTKAEPHVKVKRDKTVQKGDESKVVVKVTAPDGVSVAARSSCGQGRGQVVHGQGRRRQGGVRAASFHQDRHYTLRVKYLGSSCSRR
jgi:hypothetical protein